MADIGLDFIEYPPALYYDIYGSFEFFPLYELGRRETSGVLRILTGEFIIKDLDIRETPIYMYNFISMNNNQRKRKSGYRVMLKYDMFATNKGLEGLVELIKINDTKPSGETVEFMPTFNLTEISTLDRYNVDINITNRKKVVLDGEIYGEEFELNVDILDVIYDHFYVVEDI